MNNKKCVGPSNGWLLCESKTFPGKFYYFNVRNGDAVWTFNDGDVRITLILLLFRYFRNYVRSKKFANALVAILRIIFKTYLY